MNKIQVAKRNNEEVACWRVDAQSVTPNTQIETDGTITVLVKANGKYGIQMRPSATVISLLEPGKNSKVFGGNKPYDNVEIFAIDQSSEFSAEWGLAGDEAIPCVDKEFGVDAKAVAFGNYFYKIENYNNFINVLPFNRKGEITRDEVREFLRAETAGIIKAYLSSEIAGKDLRTCQANIADYCEELKERINKKLYTKGITVYNFVVTQLAYEPLHEAKRRVMGDAKMSVAINHVGNKGRLDDLTVSRAKADIDIDYIKALNNGEGKEKISKDNKEKPAATEYVYCSRCGERNVATNNYCQKCGEKLRK